MTIHDEYYVEKKEFVAKLSEALNMAKPHLRCEYMLGEEIDKTKIDPFAHIYDYNEYVVVTCKNGYQYFINVSANSLAAIGEAVFTKMVYK